MSINVLSLFDGISVGKLALENLGIKNQYFSSEIDKNAIKVSESNFPDIVRLGDVREVKADSLPKIDLLMGGSPCQGFSAAGKRLDFEDPRSKLFFEFVRVLKDTNPTYFLLENVKMSQKSREIITDLLEVEPVCINSGLVSAQNRVRYYWANFPITQPKDKYLTLQQELNTTSLPAAIRGRRVCPETGRANDSDRSLPLSQYIEYRSDCKSNCLTTVSKDNVLVKEYKSGRVLASEISWRYYTPEEYELLQTLPVGYTEDVSKTHRYKTIGNSWTTKVIEHILKGTYEE